MATAIQSAPRRTSRRRWRRVWRRRDRAGTQMGREGFYYLLVTLFVFTAAIIADLNLLMILAGMLAAPLWFSRRLVWATLRGLEVRRRLPREVCAGDLLVTTLDVVNSRRRMGSWALVIEDRIERQGDAGFEPLLPKVFLPYVPAGQARSSIYRGRLPERGRYRFGPLALSTRFPFGFYRRVVRLAQMAELTVFPRLGRLTQLWLQRHHVSFEGADRRERTHGGASGDFFGVRPYRSGDPRRLVHWRSSARREGLVVRQFEQQRNRDLAVLVDLWRPEAPRAADLESIELAVSFAATVVADACRRGGSDLIVGVTSRPSGCLRGPASAALLHDVMEELAVAEASPEDRLELLLDCILGKIDRGTEVALIAARAVDLADPRFAYVAREPWRRAALARIRTIDASDPALADYFEPQ